jgi:hypothetical protein
MNKINPCELTAAITAAGNLLAKNRSPEELGLLSAVFMQLADVLATIAAAQALNAAEQEASTRQNGQTASVKP